MSYGGWYNPQYMSSYQGSGSGSYYAYIWPLQQQQSYQPYYGYQSFSYQQPAQAAWSATQAFVPSPSLQHAHPLAQPCSLCGRPLNVQTQTTYTCSNLQCASHAPTAVAPVVPPPPPPPPPLAPAIEVQPASILAPEAAIAPSVAAPTEAVVPPVIPPKIPIAAPLTTTGPRILAPTDGPRSGRAHVSFQHPLEPQPMVFDVELTMAGARDGGGMGATANLPPVPEVVLDPGSSAINSAAQGCCQCRSGMTACACLRLGQIGGCNMHMHHHQHCCDGDMCHGRRGRRRLRRNRSSSTSSSDKNDDVERKGEGSRGSTKGKEREILEDPDPDITINRAARDLMS